MPAFEFRFQSVLRIRDAERQQRRAELAQAYEADRILQQQIAAQQAELAATQQRVRHAVEPGEVNVDQLLVLRRYGLQLQAQIHLLHQQQIQIREEMERRRAVLVEADRQVRTLEKLRDRDAAAFRHAEQKVEQKALDEVGTLARSAARRSGVP